MYMCIHIPMRTCWSMTNYIYRHVSRDVHVVTSRRSQRLDPATALSHLPASASQGFLGGLARVNARRISGKSSGSHRVLRTMLRVCMFFATAAAANCASISFWHGSRFVSFFK